MKNEISSARAGGTREKLGRETIPVKLARSMMLLIGITVLNATLLFSSPSSLISQSPLLPSASAQITAQDEKIIFLLSSSSLPASTTTSDDFRIAYSKIGVSGESYQRILYDSETNSLRLGNISTAFDYNESGRLSLSQGQSQSQSNRQVSESDERNLQQTVEQNGFFQANSMYPPPDNTVNESYNYLHILSIVMDNRAHTVVWTDVSENIPTTVLSIVRTIETIQSS